MAHNDFLTSWKEIAAYLGVDERTCQRWEKRYGLPVRRHDPSPKSRVFASRADLDRWMEETARDSSFAGEREEGAEAGENGPRNARGEQDPDSATGAGRAEDLPGEKPTAPRGRRRLGGLLAILVLLAAAAFLGPKILLDRRPADFRIEAPDLVVLNRSGRELWRYPTGLEDLYETEFYKQRFQYKRMTGEDRWNSPCLIIRDIDRDGRNEVLFSPQTQNELKNGKIVLLDHKGGKVWSFETGQPVRSGERDFSPDFVVAGLDIFDPDHDGIFDILVLSHALSEYPTRILVLNLKRDVLGDYWNAGQIDAYEFRDLNGDDRPEILLAGQNGEYAKPALIVFDSASVNGSSPQGDDYRFEGIGPGSEKAYILFPLTPVDELVKPGIGVTSLKILLANRIQAITGNSMIFYEFDFGLKPLAVSDSHIFMRKYAEAVREGKIKEPYNRDRILRKLQDGISYYDGATKTWVHHWALSNPW